MDCMIDIETLGTNPTCPVISIGAVYFDEKGLKEEFEIVLDVEQQIDDGRVADGATIKWWMAQENAAQKVFREEAVPVDIALRLFEKFCQKHKDIIVWGNGSVFDITILEDFFKFYKVKVPWSFRNIMDMRTFVRFNCQGIKQKNVGVAHTALADAKYQALKVIKGLKRMKRNAKRLKNGKS